MVVVSFCKLAINSMQTERVDAKRRDALCFLTETAKFGRSRGHFFFQRFPSGFAFFFVNQLRAQGLTQESFKKCRHVTGAHIMTFFIRYHSFAALVGKV